MSSADELDVIRRYLTERYPARRFVPLATLVAATGMLASPGSPQLSVADGVRGVVLAYLLVLVFRIWDDLEDRERDVLLHPGRITGRVGATKPFVALACAAAVLAVLLVLVGPQPTQRMLALALLTAVLCVWYRLRSLPRIANAFVLLAKYPVIACVAAPAALWAERDVTHATPFLLALYLFLCIHEALDDPILRRSFGRGSST